MDEDDPFFSLSVRSANALQNANISNLGELTKITAQHLLKQSNFGRKSLREVRELLAREGLALLGETPVPVTSLALVAGKPLPPAEHKMLSYLVRMHHRGTVPKHQKTVGKTLGYGQSNASDLVRRLVAKGFVESTTNLTPTQKGIDRAALPSGYGRKPSNGVTKRVTVTMRLDREVRRSLLSESKKLGISQVELIERGLASVLPGKE